MNSQRGFTLIELLIVVTIAGVIAAIALPAFDRVITRNGLSSAVVQFQAALSTARSEAIKRRADVFVVPNGSATTDWGKGWAVVTDSSVGYSDCNSATPDAACVFVSEPYDDVTVTASFASITIGSNGRSNVASDATTADDVFIFCPASPPSSFKASRVTLLLAGGSKVETGADCT
jgi:type IV fimbrial biogenesis protein FimT